MSTAQKRALHEAMEALDAEADQGNVNDGTHLRLSKKLKEAYDAELERPHDAQTTYLVIQTAQDPNSLAYVSRVYRGLTDRPQFLRRVMAWRQFIINVPVLLNTRRCTALTFANGSLKIQMR